MSKNQKMIGTWIDKDTERQFHVSAAKLGLSKAEALRQAIDLWLFWPIGILHDLAAAIKDGNAPLLMDDDEIEAMQDMLKGMTTNDRASTSKT